ncbi:MAG TPA: hypothetical protein DEG28_00930 [Porphyromonadaceae bacterium]|nr:hypothetical protein [Porphyromonadaceae bacterium]
MSGDFFDRLDKYIDHKGLNDNKVTVQCGLPVGSLGKQRKGGRGLSVQSIAKILHTYSDLNSEWLLTGKGEMLKERNLAQKVSNEESALKELGLNCDIKPIPLVNQLSVAGFGNSEFSIQEQDVKEYYVVPKFRFRTIDFMIEISGSSMYPKYNSGDVVACTIIKESRFIQWNKCHVIATREQGILVKRIKEGNDNDHILAISDNKEYPPFEIPKEEITGIAIVAGVIRLE